MQIYLSFLQKFAANFMLFQLFCSKNAKNDYFDQRLESAALKRWSKYTTDTLKTKTHYLLLSVAVGQIIHGFRDEHLFETR